MKRVRNKLVFESIKNRCNNLLICINLKLIQLQEKYIFRTIHFVLLNFRPSTQMNIKVDQFVVSFRRNFDGTEAICIRSDQSYPVTFFSNTLIFFLSSFYPPTKIF